MKLSRSTRAVINQNFLFGVLFIIGGLTVGGVWLCCARSGRGHLHNAGSLIVVFNSARLVRKGEELEHYQPEPAGAARPRRRPRRNWRRRWRELCARRDCPAAE